MSSLSYFCPSPKILAVIVCSPALPPIVVSVKSPFTNLHHPAVLVSFQSTFALKEMFNVPSVLTVTSCNVGNSIFPPPLPSSLSSEQLVNDTINIIANAMIQLIPFKFNVLIIVWF